MKTFFAPPERDSVESIHADFDKFRSFENLLDILNGLPYIALILNKERQLVFSNQYLVDLLGAKTLNELLGKRHGELINCVHSTETLAGCGTTKSCRYCGAVKAIMECLNTGKRAQGECRIIAKDEIGQDLSYDFFVSASPFKHSGRDYVILSFNDISNEKRRKILERLFFHDILNTAGGLRGFLEFLNTFPNDKDRDELLRIAKALTEQMIDEILAQRELLAAEREELIPSPQSLEASKLLEEIKHHLEHHPVALEKKIRIAAPEHSVLFIADKVLIKRVLINMAKNALEASNTDQVVTLSYNYDMSQKYIVFEVHNESEMLEAVKAQVFKRSFSTKDDSRGIGTYSMKLLGEKYLKGIVSFSSEREIGTIFRILLPLAA